MIKIAIKAWFLNLKKYGVDSNLLKLLKNDLTDCQQKVVLNGQTSSWQIIYASIPQGSLLGPFLFLIYINDLSNGLTSLCEIFGDDTSLFSKVTDKNNSNSQLNFDLAKICQWAFQWKMSFNPDLNKQAIEVRFSIKCNKENYLPSQINSTDVKITDSQGHLGLILNSKLNSNEHIESKITKCNKIIELMKKLFLTLSRESLLTIYKSFVRPNLDYANKIYDKPLNILKGKLK